MSKKIIKLAISVLDRKIKISYIFGDWGWPSQFAKRYFDSVK